MGPPYKLRFCVVKRMALFGLRERERERERERRETQNLSHGGESQVEKKGNDMCTLRKIC